jgi:TGF-beta propeptide
MIMKNRKLQLLPAIVLFLSLVSGVGAYAQITPSADAYTNTADSTTNYGANVLLNVHGATEAAYIQFNLASIPSGASVSQATLKLYVNAVTTAGSFNVDYVSGTWTESTITSSLAPALGNAIVSSVPITTADKNQYILINITSAVQAWLSGSETNNGIALVANGTFNASFDSKENTTTSHPAELDIAFAGGDGTITGVTTASGSGLSGGGTSGTLNLSLTTSCSSSQVLEWNGTAWACSTPTGGGTITGVTAGTDLTGGGTSGNVTLNLNTTALNSTYAQLNAANTFSANQTLNGNLSVAGSVSAGMISVVTSSGTTAVYGNDQSSGGSVGVQGNSTNGFALYGNSTNGIGAFAQSGSSYGVQGVSNSTGVYGIGTTGVAGESSASNGIGVSGYGTATGVYGTAGTGGIGVEGVSSSSGPGGGFYNLSTGDALFADNQHSGSFAAFFLGNVDVDGTLSKAGGSFKIDHPLDPANKYLYHSFVESPDMMNIYNGNATLDGNGEALVTLPDWFESLNRDFRYQLTCIGGFAPVYIAQKVQNNSFKIGGGQPGMEVSWQVTGIRQDAWANAHRIPVEVSKEPADQGLYLHPELFGAPAEKSIALAHHPMIPRLQLQQATKLNTPTK